MFNAKGACEAKETFFRKNNIFDEVLYINVLRLKASTAAFAKDFYYYSERKEGQTRTDDDRAFEQLLLVVVLIAFSFFLSF